jgi:hypothetical protein
MAALTTADTHDRTIAAAGKNLKRLTGYGTIAAADVDATLNLNGKISRITFAAAHSVGHFEMVVPTTAQPVAGVLTFERDNVGAAVTFWYEVEGY